MKNTSINIYYALFVAFALAIAGCTAGGNETGTEYMPDMKHSIAYESNYYNYYSYNTWGTEEEYHEYAQPRTPVKNTIPIGATGMSMAKNESEKKNMENAFRGLPQDGFVPFYYDDTEEERTRAQNEIKRNPYPITTEGMKRGSELYTVFCGICHGSKGAGNGYLIRDGSPYPAVPANLINDEFVNASNGRFYFAIMHGKNVMGSYADKLSYEERWQVIHYIRSLQAKEKDKEYSQEKNTLTNYATPYDMVADSLEMSMSDESMMQDSIENSQSVNENEETQNEEGQ